VVILAEFPPNLELTAHEIVRRVSAQLDKADIKQRERVLLAPERVIVLRGAQRTLATAIGDVPEARRDPRRLLGFINALHQTIKKPPLEPGDSEPGPEQGPGEYPPEQRGGSETGQRSTAHTQPGSTGDQPQPAPASAPAAAARALTADADGFDLRAASPNWLSSGAPYITGGGPGAWPVGAASVTPNPADPQPWDFDLPPTLQPPILGALDVEVAILDTAPSMISLQSAYAKWVGNDQVQPPQPPLQTLNLLLKRLLAAPSGGQFNVVDQSSTPDSIGAADQLDVIYLPDLIPAVLAENPYPMTSHGLFIAGMIRSVAPKAKLRLIQVLNSDGGGSLDSIAQGLAYANHAGRTAPLVINCSFVLNIPRPGDPAQPSDLQGLPQSTIDSLTQTMSDMFAHTNQSPNLLIAAAAGNAGTGATHPSPRFPAALAAVAGVAALKQDDSDPNTPPALADYSDLADDQLAEGFAVFGGESVSTNTPPTTDPAKGMLGIFIDRLPVPGTPPSSAILVPNTTGWARWAGTSFATPIISAVLANLIGGGLSPAAALQQLDTIAPDIGVTNALELRQLS
jgi:hypothetical protein